MERALASELPTGPLLVRHASHSVLLDRETLGNSEVLRKLCGPLTQSDLTLQDDGLFAACCSLSRLPTTPWELLEWLGSIDAQRLKAV